MSSSKLDVLNAFHFSSRPHALNNRAESASLAYSGNNERKQLSIHSGRVQTALRQSHSVG